jgi:lysophospholipase L1-like esterase
MNLIDRTAGAVMSLPDLLRQVITMRTWKALLRPLVLSGLGFSCLLAAGVMARAQAPATVTPASRDGGWMKLHESFLDQAKKGNIDLLFLGDSITHGWNNNDVWQRFYGPRHAANFGIGGDQTQHVLWRIEHGEIDGIHPRVVVLMIGTNNAGSSTSVEIAAGIRAIVGELHKRLPDSKILLLGVFPRGQKPNGLREQLEDVNQQISSLHDGKALTYLDIGKAFLDADGAISPEIMPDYLHLSARGYRIWADAMEPTLWRLLDDPASTK